MATCRFSALGLAWLFLITWSNGRVMIDAVRMSLLPNLVTAGAFLPVVAPVVGGMLFFLAWLTDLSLSERGASRILIASICTGLLGSTVVAGALLSGTRLAAWGEIAWSTLPLTVGVGTTLFLGVAQLLLGAISRFASNYLHGDPGYQKFMGLFVLLQLGVALVSTAPSLSVVFVGWELVGVASFLLIGFFTKLETAGRRSILAFVCYKIADMGLILACVLLPHGEHRLLLGSALIFGTLAKGGIFPFVTWIPRAMEGPTPSSAAFYGAVSVHLAPLLLWRMTDLWFWSPELRIVVAVLGALTALMTASIGRTRSNVKGQLAYAIMAQMGVIYLELALGLHRLALAHMLCHASLRTAQFLRSGSVLADYHRSQLDVGVRPVGVHVSVPSRLFVHAWNGFYVEPLLDAWVVAPVLKVARLCDRPNVWFWRRTESRLKTIDEVKS